jgi:hypothetical protein
VIRAAGGGAKEEADMARKEEEEEEALEKAEASEVEVEAFTRLRMLHPSNASLRREPQSSVPRGALVNILR